jgi:hypothetical protein
MVTFYYNSATGQSQYQVPQEYEQWEKLHGQWVAAQAAARPQ